jgi:hypothetical protein
MSLEQALRVLDEEANRDINYAIGDLLRERALRDDWRQCSILQQLETGRNIRVWNELCQRTRRALANEADLPRKASSLLRPGSSSFDRALDDFIAEMLAALYLSRLGHSGISFPAEENPITTDLISVHNGTNYVTEAKNLREPNSLAYLAYARWHHNRASNPEAFNFTAQFVRIDDPFEDLTAEQMEALRNLIDVLPERQRPSDFRITLPGNRALWVHVADGPGVMVQHGPGPFLVNEAVEECQRAIFLKLMEPARKALTQLYSNAVSAEYRRLLFIRWKPPDSIAAIGEADGVREVVLDRFQTFIRHFFPSFALAILHTYEELDHVPPAQW